MVGIIICLFHDSGLVVLTVSAAVNTCLGAKGMLPYKLALILVIVIGPVLSLDLGWTVANILNALMAVPNLIAVLLLSGVIARETVHYLNHLDEKTETEIPVVDR